MSSKAFVDIFKTDFFKNADDDVQSELVIVQNILNMTPTVKNNRNNQWEASPINLAVQLYQANIVALVSEMVSQGLSFANKDYYIFIQFGNKPSVSKSPNGMIKAVSKLAEKRGYLANINKGCVFTGYLKLAVKRDGMMDSLTLENSPESEISQPKDGDIVAPYAVATLINRKGVAVSRKVCIVRNNEFIKAKSQSKNQLHNQYPVPMAEKIAVKRLCQEMLAMLGGGDQESSELQEEMNDHDNDYDMSSGNHGQSAEQSADYEQQEYDATKALEDSIQAIKKASSIPLLKALWKKIDAIDKSLVSEPQIEEAKAAYIKQLKSIKGDK